MTTNALKVEDDLQREHILWDALTPKKLDLIIMPTEQCNFRCTYCYEDFKIGKMPRWVVNGIKALIDARGSRTPVTNDFVVRWRTTYRI